MLNVIDLTDFGSSLPLSPNLQKLCSILSNDSDNFSTPKGSTEFPEISLTILKHAKHCNGVYLHDTKILSFKHKFQHHLS